MTISLKVSVNGDYVATVKHQIDGEDAQEKVVIGGSGPVEETIYFRHGAVNTYEITEEPGEQYRDRVEHEKANDSTDGE